MELGLYVVMELVPTEKTLLYFPFQECLMTMKEQTSSAHSVGELLPLLGIPSLDPYRTILLTV